MELYSQEEFKSGIRHAWRKGGTLKMQLHTDQLSPERLIKERL